MSLNNTQYGIKARREGTAGALDKEILELEKELCRIKELTEAARQRVEQAEKEGNTRCAELSEEAYKAGDKYSKSLESIIEGYKASKDKGIYFTKDAKSRFRKYIPGSEEKQKTDQ